MNRGRSVYYWQDVLAGRDNELAKDRCNHASVFVMRSFGDVAVMVCLLEVISSDMTFGGLAMR